MAKSQITNKAKIPLSMAVFLAVDHYDHDPGTLSATALLKPLRQAILSRRVPPELMTVELADLLSSRNGTAIHDGIERAWTDHHKQALEKLGYSPDIIRRFKINPDPKTVTATDIPVYMELRSYKEFMGFRISGKFDFVGDGALEDFKTTSTFSFMSGTKDKDYVLQGSIYRWLNPNIITKDTMSIQFIFTDWQSFMAKQNANYPQYKTATRRFELLSLEETEAYVRNRLEQYMKYKDAAELDLPECTASELWRSDPVWKYYKNPQKKTKATKNFDNEKEGVERFLADGSVGELVMIPGLVKACAYCPAYPVCTQKDRLILSGDLVN